MLMVSNTIKGVSRAEMLQLKHAQCNPLFRTLAAYNICIVMHTCTLLIFFGITTISTTPRASLLSIYNLQHYFPQRMRHKKDGFSAKGKKHSNAPRHRPTPHEEGEAQNRRPPFKAACWDLEHCDPKRCSGKRLMHFGLMRELSVGQKFQGVVIS